MRIIGNIKHPDLKITVFQMDNRLSVKLESGLYEQTYKFRSGEGMDSLQDIEALLDQDFLSHVIGQMQQMHQNRMAAIARQNPKAEEEFDKIIWRNSKEIYKITHYKP